MPGPDFNPLLRSRHTLKNQRKNDMDTKPEKPWYYGRGLIVLAGAFIYCAYSFLSAGTRIEVILLVFFVFVIMAGVSIVFQRLFSPDYFSRMDEQSSSDKSDGKEIIKK
jgi:hypothetical protein